MMEPFPVIHFPREVPNVWEMEPVKWRPRDITEDIMGRILPPLPKHMIDLIHVCVPGAPGSGKSEMVKCLASRACDRYGHDNVHMFVTDDLAVAIAEVDPRPVQFLFIDDAAKYNNSKQAGKKENIDKTGDFQLLRHIQRKASGRRNGLVICIFGWQRYLDLIPALRAGYITIFKSGQAGRYDYTEVENMLGPYTQLLGDIWDRGKRGDTDAKNLSIAHIAPLKGTGRENGLLRTRMVDLPEWPDMISSADYFGEEPEAVEEIEIPDRCASLVGILGEEAVRCYAAAEAGLSTRKAAERVGLSPTTCYRNILRVREALGET